VSPQTTNFDLPRHRRGRGVSASPHATYSRLLEREVDAALGVIVEELEAVVAGARVVIRLDST